MSRQSREAKASPDLSDRLRRLIEGGGPIPLPQYMALANAHYYGTRDPLGAAGDFTTAPEISQMFGELIGLWCADLWLRAEQPALCWVELGPGRGTLATDARRAMAKAGLEPPMHFVETSPALTLAQRSAVPDGHWHASIDTLPDDEPLIIVANEFFDALPVRQLHRTEQGWRERMVDHDGDRLVPMLGQIRFDAAIPDDLRTAHVVETSPAGVAVMQSLAHRLVQQGGALLVIDYGYEGPLAGDTLQALRAHRFADPFQAPGDQDLTAHVDFAALAATARAQGALPHPLKDQGAFLAALGIHARATALARATGETNTIEAAYRRLVAPDEMGTIFKVLAITSRTWPQPGGFA